MDIHLSDEQIEFKQMARDLADKRIYPHALEFDEHEGVPPELIKECAELGYFGSACRISTAVWDSQPRILSA